MSSRALPALLVLVALAADLSGHHTLALPILLAAIPAAFAYALDCYGDALHARCGGLRPLLAGAALILLVVSTALRSPALVGGVPRIAMSLAVATLLLYGALAVGGLVLRAQTA